MWLLIHAEIKVDLFLVKEASDNKQQGSTWTYHAGWRMDCIHWNLWDTGTSAIGIVTDLDIDWNERKYEDNAALYKSER